MGISGDAVADYQKAVRRADLEEAGDDDVFRKVRGDFDAKGISISDEELREKMVSCMEQAITQIESEG